MPAIDFFLREPKSTKPTAVGISVYCDDGRARRTVDGAKIHPDYWASGWFKNVPKNKELAACLSKVENKKKKIEQYISHCELHNLPVKKAEVEEIIKPKKAAARKKVQEDFLLMYQKLYNMAEAGHIKTQEKDTRYTDGTLKIWRLNKNLLTAFRDKTGANLTAATLTIETVEAFKTWMNTRPKASLNYVSLHVGLWRNIIEIMHHRGWHSNEIFKDERFSGAFEKVAKMKVDEADVIKLFNYDLSNKPYLQAIRDRWALMYCTGLRVSDSRRLTLDHFGKDFISLINQKTGKKVVIPYHWMTRRILQRYDGQLPRNVRANIMNKKIKEIARDTGLFNQRFTYKITRKGVRLEETKYHWQLFICHTARRSMTNTLIVNMVPWEAGGDMMGMSPSTWKRYMSLTPEDKAVALQKKLDIFKGEG